MNLSVVCVVLCLAVVYHQRQVEGFRSWKTNPWLKFKNSGSKGAVKRNYKDYSLQGMCLKFCVFLYPLWLAIVYFMCYYNHIQISLLSWHIQHASCPTITNRMQKIMLVGKFVDALRLLKGIFIFLNRNISSIFSPFAFTFTQPINTW